MTNACPAADGAACQPLSITKDGCLGGKAQAALRGFCGSASYWSLGRAIAARKAACCRLPHSAYNSGLSQGHIAVGRSTQCSGRGVRNMLWTRSEARLVGTEHGRKSFGQARCNPVTTDILDRALAARTAQRDAVCPVKAAGSGHLRSGEDPVSACGNACRAAGRYFA